MAVCGRCLICGHKFSCGKEDEAVRWACTSSHRECVRDAEADAKYGEIHEHAICTGCHDVLVSGDLTGAVNDLLNLVRARTTST